MYLNLLEPSGPVQACNGVALPFSNVNNALYHTSTSPYTFMARSLIKRRENFTFDLPLRGRFLKSPLYVSCPEPHTHFLPSLACCITRQSLLFYCINNITSRLMPFWRHFPLRYTWRQVLETAMHLLQHISPQFYILLVQITEQPNMVQIKLRHTLQEIVHSL